ncbi:MAG: metal-dependent transcriptional regulator, partial [Candidatus Poseidoniia archaeon]|nr:metal-dependent transcriptional regulator [Candidatus Poseidoniia archaeon]
QGQHVADVIEHRFDILQLFLTEILGMEKEEAAEVACRMEHILTRDVETRLSNFLGVDSDNASEIINKKISVDSEPEPDFLPLTNFREGKTGKVRIILEKSELTETLEQAGLSPGRTIMVKKVNDKCYDVETENASLSLDRDLAAKIIVQN